ncbi:putative hydantoinase [Meredithblackwellia eburnea MCA 4105]
MPARLINQDPARRLRLGVDVGGTNTDAVLLDLAPTHRGAVLASHKAPTTKDVTDGIEAAIRAVLPSDTLEAVQTLSIGTTHFVNALVERNTRLLDRVAVIRLCGPFSHGTPPFVGFPRELRAILEGPSFLLSGGLQIDGREIAPISKEEVEAACSEIKKQNIRAIAIVSVYAPIDFTIKQEEATAEIIKSILPNVAITLSKTIANIGILERENASILNASLLRYAGRTVKGFKAAAERLGLSCPIFITSNDGTLLSCDQAAAMPIRTFSSGPTNSMRGAAFLASLESGGGKGEAALVVDIGGTTTEVGMLLPTGFPRQAAAHHSLCGVRLNFSMPHVTSIGLGGGSLVREGDCGKVTIGPDSVGYRILSEGLVFGGSTLTATDVVVASGRVPEVGDGKSVSHLSTALISAAEQRIKTMLETTLDAMKTSAQDMPVYLVGGGAILAPDTLNGISRVVRFTNFGVANAVGAAIAQVAGNVDVVEDIQDAPMSEVRRRVEALAVKKAIDAGANPSTVTIIESEAIPIAYTAGRCRFVVKAAGDWLGVFSTAQEAKLPMTVDFRNVDTEEVTSGSLFDAALVVPDVPPTAAELVDYRPTVADGIWTLSELDLEFIAEGCYILGCGGGGSPYHMFLQLRQAVRAGEKVKVADLSSFSDDEMIGWGGCMGSPEVSGERMAGEEYDEAVAALTKFMGISKLAGLCALEIGGSNGMINMITGSSTRLDIPVIDGDFMGRAYPTGWQTTPNVYDFSGRGENQLPGCISSGDGNIIFMSKAKTDRDIDASLRAACCEMGTLVGHACRPLTAKFCRTSVVPNTVSLAWRLGRAIAITTAQHNLSQVGRVLVDALGGSKTGRILFSGKIVDVSRHVFKGHTIGKVTIQAFASEEEENEESKERFVGKMVIPFKNENLYAEVDAGDGGSKQIIATVPDLIAVLDAQSGVALGTPDYKYGLRVLVLGITAAPQWTSTPRGLELGSLTAFGYSDIPYVPLGEYVKPRSVIEEFA